MDHWTDLAAFERLCPEMYHLSDNDFLSEIDGHLNLGHGNYDFHRILESIDASKPISLETKKQFGESLRDFKSEVRFLNNRLYEYSFNPVTISDMKDVFELANDPVVRACSIRQDAITWETHCAWFEKKLKNREDTGFKTILLSTANSLMLNGFNTSAALTAT